jgi:GAF domain-containing protein
MDQFLSEASRNADARGNAADYLERVARTAVPALADFCLIYLLEGDNLACVASAHRTHAGDRLLRALIKVYKIRRTDPDSTVAQVVRSGRPSLRGDIRPERPTTQPRFTALARVFNIHQQLAVRSALVLPIEGRAGVIGAIGLSFSESGRRYKPADITVGEQIAQRIALALDNARLAASQRQQASLGRRARPALTRLRQAIDRLLSTDNVGDRRRLLNEVARQERTLTRMLERHLASCPPSTPRGSRLRARS